jgi:hypothetical protein
VSEGCHAAQPASPSPPLIGKPARHVRGLRCSHFHSLTATVSPHRAIRDVHQRPRPSSSRRAEAPTSPRSHWLRAQFTAFTSTSSVASGRSPIEQHRTRHCHAHCPQPFTAAHPARPLSPLHAGPPRASALNHCDRLPAQQVQPSVPRRSACPSHHRAPSSLEQRIPPGFVSRPD